MWTAGDGAVAALLLAVAVVVAVAVAGCSPLRDPWGSALTQPRVSVRAAGAELLVEAALPREAVAELLSAVTAATDEGLASEITFEVQLYQEAGGVARVFGDRLLASERMGRILTWDPFLRSYSVDAAGGGSHVAVDRDRLAEAFLTLSGYSIPSALPGRGSRCYVRVRARVEPVRTVEALRVLAIFTSGRTWASDWGRAVVE